MKKFIHHFKIAKSCPWELLSNKGDQYSFWLFLGKVTKNDMTGYLVVIGPIYFIFNWK